MHTLNSLFYRTSLSLLEKKNRNGEKRERETERGRKREESCCVCARKRERKRERETDAFVVSWSPVSDSTVSPSVSLSLSLSTPELCSAWRQYSVDGGFTAGERVKFFFERGRKEGKIKSGRIKKKTHARVKELGKWASHGWKIGFVSQDKSIKMCNTEKIKILVCFYFIL